MRAIGAFGIFFLIMVIVVSHFRDAFAGGTNIGNDPMKPGATINIRDYGAQGDGRAKDTHAIQDAIDAACKAGGGTVFFPPGTYLSGTLFLKNNVTIYLATGATLLGSTDLNDFPVCEPAFRSYTDTYVRQSLIYGENVEKVAITGSGVIDGQGAAFKDHSYLIRPYLIRIITSRHILVEDVTLKNSPMWMEHYLACDFVTLRGLKIYNQVNANNDMIDIDCCRNVHISDCYGDTGDDCITLKSTADRICENVTITNCIVNSNCNGIKFGTESNGGFRNVTISNCVVNSFREEKGIVGRTRGISGISLEMVDGGIFDRVAISNITISGVDVPIFLRLGNRARPFKQDMQKPGMGAFRNVVISDVVAEASSPIGCSITGLPGYPVENVTLSNIRITFPGGGTKDDAGKQVAEHAEKYPEAFMFGTLPSYGFYCRHVKGLRLNNIDFHLESPDRRPSFIFEDVDNLDINGYRGEASPDGSPFIVMKDVRDAMIQGCIAPPNTTSFIRLEGKTEGVSVLGNDLSQAQIPFELAPPLNNSALFQKANKLIP